MPLQFSYPQQASLAILPKITSFISMCGSSWIIIEVAGSHTKRYAVYNRLLFCMSVFDFLVALSYFASTWPIPRGSPGVLWALGTTQSCTTQGFFNQLGVVPPVYNCCLSFYYMLVVKYGVSEEYMARNVEFWMHLGSLGLGFATATASIPLELFNNADLWCWIAPLPFDCSDSYTYGETNCIRGNNAWIYRWAFFYAPIWASMLLVTIINIAVYRTVRKREKEAISQHKEHHERHGQLTARDAFHDLVHDERKCKDEHKKPRHKNRATSVRLQGTTNHHRRRGTWLKGSHSRRPTFFGFDGFNLASSVDTVSVGAGAIAHFVLPEKLAEKYRTPPSSSMGNNSTDSPPLHQRGRQREDPVVDPGATITSADIEFVLEIIEEYPSAARQNAAAYQYGTLVILYQSLAYTGAFYLVWLFPSVNRIVQHTTVNNYFVLLLLQCFFEPLQGLCNVLVYRFAFYLRLRQRNPHLTKWELFQHTWRWSFLGPPPNARQLDPVRARANALGRMRRRSSVFGADGRDSFLGRETSSRATSRPSDLLGVSGILQSHSPRGNSESSTALGSLVRVGLKNSESAGGQDESYRVNPIEEDAFLHAHDRVNRIMEDLFVDYYDNPTALNGKMVVVKTNFAAIDSFSDLYSTVDPPLTATPTSFPVVSHVSIHTENIGGLAMADFPLVEDDQGCQLSVDEGDEGLHSDDFRIPSGRSSTLFSVENSGNSLDSSVGMVRPN
jgi:hypothetical protein